VLLDGFYEWTKDIESKRRQPYYIHHPDRLMKTAGLFDAWKTKSVVDDAENEDEDLFTYTILTTDASSRFTWLHDR
jgi:putative SOS response-associated peptidase YedK